MKKELVFPLIFLLVVLFAAKAVTKARPCGERQESPLLWSQCLTRLGESYTDSYAPTIALTKCSRLHDEQAKTCANGVYRGIVEESSYDAAFCSYMPAPFRSQCYFWLPTALEIHGSQLRQIGELCEGIEEAPHRKECFGGLGRLLVSNDSYRLTEVAFGCRSFQTSEGVAFCMIEATRDMLLRGLTNPLVPCGQLEGNLIEICLNAANQFACNVLSECMNTNTISIQNEPSDFLFVGEKTIPLIDYNATQTQKNRFTQAVHGSATTSSGIKFDENCHMSPPVIKIRGQAPLAIYNSGEKSLDISMAKRVGELTADVSWSLVTPEASGIYGVACDGDVVGFVWVE